MGVSAADPPAGPSVPVYERTPRPSGLLRPPPDRDPDEPIPEVHPSPVGSGTSARPGSVSTRSAEANASRPPRRPSAGPIGIDLGTTGSTMCALLDGDPVVLPNAEGSRSTPSVVTFSASGEVLVGARALAQADANPERTVRSVKRQLGSDWSFTVDGTVFTSQEVVARILAKLRRDAEAHLGMPVDQAVLTCPASFDDSQRTALIEAGEIAGIEVLRVIGAPAATGIGLGATGAADETYAIVDLGGGCLSISVVEVAEGVIEVKNVVGDARLGGDDWDEAIVGWLVQRARLRHGVDLAFEALAWSRLRTASEEAKIDLSQARDVTIVVPAVARAMDGSWLDVHETLTRGEFEGLTAGLLARARGLLESAVTYQDIDRVVLVGEATRMPAIEAMVRDVVGRPVVGGLDRRASGAVGAAIQAGVLTGQVKELLLLDVYPTALGIEMSDGDLYGMIGSDTTIPTKRMDWFVASDPTLSTVAIDVRQGDRGPAGASPHLGTLELVGLPPAVDGERTIVVTLDIDINGIVHASAVDAASGIESSLTVTGRSTVSRTELDRMIRQVEAEVEASVLVDSNGDAGAAALDDRLTTVPEPPAAGGEATLAAIRALLPALDVCEMAATNGDHHLDATHADLTATLERLGITRVDGTGMAFDPTRHDAMRHDEPNTLPTGPVVARVLRPGYWWRDRLVRAALVEVRG